MKDTIFVFEMIKDLKCAIEMVWKNFISISKQLPVNNMNNTSYLYLGVKMSAMKYKMLNIKTTG